MQNLNADNAYIFRITHRDNLEWILEHGISSRSTGQLNPNHVDIGDPELIAKRNPWPIPVEPGGTLSDYVPFYFTPRSPMLLNIRTGHRGIRKIPNEEIVILVSDLHRIANMGLPFLFTDRHAYIKTAKFFSDLARLDVIDWDILRRSDFGRDNNDLGKGERYQAEALVHNHVPLAALRGIVCCNVEEVAKVNAQTAAAGIALSTAARPGWYFQ